MSSTTRIAAFLVGLVVVLGVAFAVGRLAGPDDAERTAHGEGDHDSHEPGSDAFALELAEEALAPGTREVAFTVSRGGEPVTDYEVVHEKRLHLIAVREDLAGYQHVHPELDGDGTWTTRLRLQPGPWRLYADFQAQGAEPTVVDARLLVSGDEAVEAPRRITTTATVDGYRVELLGDLAAGEASVLTPRVTRGGRDVTDELEPYLGARGHLVALRHGDLAYQHVHPDGLDFHTEVPSEGTYELYLDFKVDGVVRTARFTLDAASGDGTEGHHDH